MAKGKWEILTKGSLDHMTEPQWMVERIKDDLVLQLTLQQSGVIRDLDREQISKLAARLDVSAQ
jgi:hypothetical protein